MGGTYISNIGRPFIKNDIRLYHCEICGMTTMLPGIVSGYICPVCRNEVQGSRETEYYEPIVEEHRLILKQKRVHRIPNPYNCTINSSVMYYQIYIYDDGRTLRITQKYQGGKKTKNIGNISYRYDNLSNYVNNQIAVNTIRDWMVKKYGKTMENKRLIPIQNRFPNFFITDNCWGLHDIFYSPRSDGLIGFHPWSLLLRINRFVNPVDEFMRMLFVDIDTAEHIYSSILHNKLDGLIALQVYQNLKHKKKFPEEYDKKLHLFEPRTEYDPYEYVPF